jgi:hypothetical protein
MVCLLIGETLVLAITDLINVPSEVVIFR